MAATMQGDGPERCSHTLDPERWEREHYEPCQIDLEDDANILKTVDGRQVWHCPHAATKGHDKCVFHLQSDEKPEDTDSVEEFLAIVDGERDALDGDGQRPPQFIGSIFEGLDINRERFGDGKTIDLRHARVGRMVWRVNIVDAPINASGAVIEGICECGDVTFQSDVRFKSAHFEYKTSFADPTYSFASRSGKLVTLFDEQKYQGTIFNGVSYFSALSSTNKLIFRALFLIIDPTLTRQDLTGRLRLNT